MQKRSEVSIELQTNRIHHKSFSFTVQNSLYDVLLVEKRKYRWKTREFRSSPIHNLWLFFSLCCHVSAQNMRIYQEDHQNFATKRSLLINFSIYSHTHIWVASQQISPRHGLEYWKLFGKYHYIAQFDPLNGFFTSLHFVLPALRLFSHIHSKVLFSSSRVLITLYNS